MLLNGFQRETGNKNRGRVNKGVGGRERETVVKRQQARIYKREGERMESVIK